MIDLYLDPIGNDADVVLYDPSAAEGSSAVAFAGSASFTLAASSLLSASVAFVSSATFTVGTEAPQPVVGSGGWASHRPRRWQMLPPPVPVVHSASVSFSVSAQFRAEAGAVRAGAVVFAGMGSFAAGASLAHAASVGFSARAQLEAHASAFRAVSVAYNGAGIFASVASVDRAASAGFGASAGFRVRASIRPRVGIYQDRDNQRRIYQLIVYAEAA